MKHRYSDITENIDERPQWWDEAGVPRYCEFSPRAVNNIYASEVALLEIACQSCQTRFQVAMSWHMRENLVRNERFHIPPLHEQIKNNSIHYGDPPNYGCCPAGPTMNSIPLRVIEFWQKQYLEFVRLPEYERKNECEWAVRTEHEEGIPVIRGSHQENETKNIY